MPGLRFALDEDVSQRLASLLRAKGENADSAKELGRLGLSDARALLLAAESNQTFVTHNEGDFRSLHEAWVTWRQRWSHEIADLVGHQVNLSHHAGIVIIPHGDVHDLAHIIEEFAMQTRTNEDRLFIWNRARGWHELHL